MFIIKFIIKVLFSLMWLPLKSITWMVVLVFIISATAFAPSSPILFSVSSFVISFLKYSSRFQNTVNDPLSAKTSKMFAVCRVRVFFSILHLDECPLYRVLQNNSREGRGTPIQPSCRRISSEVPIFNMFP